LAAKPLCFSKSQQINLLIFYFLYDLSLRDILYIHKLEVMTAINNQLTRYLDFLKSDPDNAELLTRTIDLCIEARELARARELLDRALPLRPDDPRLHFYRAIIAIDAHNFVDAEEVLARLLASGIDNAGVRYNLGLCQLHNHAPQRAFETLQVFTEQMPEHAPQAKLLLARAIHHLGDLDAAQQQIEHYLAIDPDSAEALGYLALLFLDGDADNEMCREAALRALRRDADNSEALIVLGTLALEQFELAEAEKHFERVLERNPHSGRAWMAKGIAALAAQRLSDAEILLTRAVEGLPKHLGTRVALGWSQIAQSKFIEAERTFQTAIVLNRLFGESHAGLAIVWIMQERIVEATERTKLAKRLSPPGSISVQYAETLLAYVAGEPDKARAMVANILNSPITPNSPPLRDALVKLTKNSAAAAAVQQLLATDSSVNDV
jgi:tetratricopeptide (TPR) repeat protein